MLAQLLEAAAELVKLDQAGYVLKRPVEADALMLSRAELERLS